ncbi:MAG: SDR family oxidoreductase [Tepidiformaceae bacterium]
MNATSTSTTTASNVVKHGVPLGREQTPEDVGRLVTFPASDAAHNITGQAIPVDGGITLQSSRGRGLSAGE